ncbi:MAG: class I SAM-dependent methyltransferase [Candidatus Jorgensenbacteria bacterium]
MERFEHEGKEYWESFGKSMELSPRQYFDFVSAEQYGELLEDIDLKDKNVIDIGAGFPPPATDSPEKRFAPLASELPQIFERKGAKIVAVDVATEALRKQQEAGREAVLASTFQLPFKTESVDGGCLILNLFNSSFGGDGRKEIFIKPNECSHVLKEVFRVLRKGAFTIINNYGYITAYLDGSMKIMGPEEKEMISPEETADMAKKIGFRKIQRIPLDTERVEMGKKVMLESFPESLREKLSIKLSESGALFIKK